MTVSSYGYTQWLPVIGGPTIVLMQYAESCRDSKSVWLDKQVLSRGACVAAVATSAVEAFGHAITTVGLCLGLTGRILIRVVNRGLAGAIGAVWGMVYGSLFTFSLSVWLGRVVMNVYLFSRDISIAWKHWMERTIACADLFWVGVRLWALAGKIDETLSIPFNQECCMHHLGLTWSHLAFSCAGALVSFVSPDIVIRSCKGHELGRSVPAPFLRQRIWKLISRHKAVSLSCMAMMAIGTDYLLTKPKSVHAYATRITSKMSDVGSVTISWTFGLLVDIPTIISNLSIYLKESLVKIKHENELNAIQLHEKTGKYPSGYEYLALN